MPCMHASCSLLIPARHACMQSGGAGETKDARHISFFFSPPLFLWKVKSSEAMDEAGTPTIEMRNRGPSPSVHPSIVGNETH